MNHGFDNTEDDFKNNSGHTHCITLDQPLAFKSKCICSFSRIVWASISAEQGAPQSGMEIQDQWFAKKGVYAKWLWR